MEARESGVSGRIGAGEYVWAWKEGGKYIYCRREGAGNIKGFQRHIVANVNSGVKSIIYIVKRQAFVYSSDTLKG